MPPVKERERRGERGRTAGGDNGDGDATPVCALAPRLPHQPATTTAREEERLSERERKGTGRAPQQWRRHTGDRWFTRLLWLRFTTGKRERGQV